MPSMNGSLDATVMASHNEYDDLPAPKEITRATLSDPSFDVEAFLNDHCRFQSLTDLRRNIMSWESRLHTELMDTVNENYGEFLRSADSLDEGSLQLDAVRLEVLRFQSEVTRTDAYLGKSVAELEAELMEQRRLATVDASARKLLRFLDFLDELDDGIALHSGSAPARGFASADDLESWSKTYVAALYIAKEEHEHVLVQSAHKRLSTIRSGILGLFEQFLAKERQQRTQASDSNSSELFRVHTAKSWIISVGHK